MTKDAEFNVNAKLMISSAAPSSKMLISYAKTTPSQSVRDDLTSHQMSSQSFISRPERNSDQLKRDYQSLAVFHPQESARDQTISDGNFGLLYDSKDKNRHSEIAPTLITQSDDNEGKSADEMNFGSPKNNDTVQY